MRLDNKRLKAFVTVAEEGSFTRAASVLNATQPSISIQLKLLEDELELSLVERGRGKGMRLTATGERFLEIARSVLQSYDSAIVEINALKAETGHKITLGVDPITLYISERNELIAKFLDKFGDRVTLLSETPAALLKGLEAGVYDIILTSGVPPPGIEKKTLFEGQLHLAIPNSKIEEYKAVEDGVLRDVELLVLPQDFHPTVISNIRSQFEDRNVRVRNCPETGYHALIRYGALMGIAVMTPDFSDSVVELRSTMQLQKLRDPKIVISWGVMRRTDAHSSITDRFWEIAGQMDPITIG